MDIQSEKIELIRMLLDTENSKIIDSIRKIFKNEKSSNFWEDLSNQQREEVEKASTQIENGEVVDYESFMQKHR